MRLLFGLITNLSIITTRMLALLCPKVLANIAIPVLVAASTLAQHLGMLNSIFRHLAHLTLVIATTIVWLVQPTKLLYIMVKRPLGCDNSNQPFLLLSVFTEKITWYKDTHLCLLILILFSLLLLPLLCV